MFIRKFDDKRYKVISTDCGLELKVDRYKGSNIKIGTKLEAEQKGLGPKGKNSFYTIADGSIVVDGYLGEISNENKVEVKGTLNITQSNWEEIKNEIEFLLNFNEE